MKKASIYIIIAIGVIISGCTATGGTVTISPVCSAGQVTPEFESMWSTWQGLIVVATFVVFLVSAFVYTLGYLLIHRKVVAWAKNQMFEGFISLIMALFFITFTSTLCSLDVSIISQGTCYTPPNPAVGCTPATGWAPPGECPITNSCNAQDVGFALLDKFRDATWKSYLAVAAVESFLAFFASYTFDVSFGGVGIAIGVLSGLSQLTNPLSLGMSMLTIAYVLTNTQMIILRLAEGLFVIMLPLGIILRSIGATRGFGGSLIAIAIGFFFVYPFLVVLFYGDLLRLNLFAIGPYGDISAISGTAGDLTPYLDPSTVSSYSSNPSGLESSFPIGMLQDWIGSIINYVAMAMVGAVIIPAIMFIVLVAFVKGLSRAIGEEVDVSNLTRLI